MDKRFQVKSVQVRVQREPRLDGTLVKWLPPGQLVQVNPASRIEADGYVWWKHAEGWTAERTLDGAEIYLVELDEESSEAGQEQSQLKELPSKREFQVGNERVRVRSEPSLKGETVNWLSADQLIEVDPGSRTRADGNVWWRHDEGWSAQRSVDKTSVFLFKPGKVPSKDAPAGAEAMSDGLPDAAKLPFRNKLFKRMPVDLDKVQFWQYYGNNVFAHNLWREGKQWYSYAQGLHAGLDLGNSRTRGVQIRAGLEGTFFKHDTTRTRPNGLWVKVGDYIVIYGHVANPRSLRVGQPIGVDTVMGEIEFGGQVHLHLEVRYRERWIVNPLLLMPKAMRNAIIKKFPPREGHFYTSSGWTAWQTPLDQPVLELGGRLIGPYA